MSALAKENQVHPVVANPMVMSLSQTTATPRSLTPTVSQEGSMIMSTSHQPEGAVIDHGDISLAVGETSQEVYYVNHCHAGDVDIYF